jgi:hypothetical protein
MADFVFDVDVDGTIKRITKDGQPNTARVVLEQHYSIVTVYFKSASYNINQMRKFEDSSVRRMFGMQSFIMCLTGLEAFTNTFFHQRSNELKNESITALLKKNHGSLSKKIEKLIELSFETKIRDQDLLVNKLFEYSQLRNEIVHPGWEPASAVLNHPEPIIFQGMVENFQSTFEDESCCLAALYWSLLLIARIGESCGNTNPSGFLFHWTGSYGIIVENIEKAIGLSAKN